MPNLYHRHQAFRLAEDLVFFFLLCVFMGCILKQKTNSRLIYCVKVMWELVKNIVIVLWKNGKMQAVQLAFERGHSKRTAKENEQ